MLEACASVTISLSFDPGERKYVATVNRGPDSLGPLTKKGATPGEAATLVWGAAIQHLLSQLDDASE